MVCIACPSAICGEGGGVGFVVFAVCGGISVCCGLFMFVKEVGGAGNSVDACYSASLIVLGVCLYIF